MILLKIPYKKDVVVFNFTSLVYKKQYKTYCLRHPITLEIKYIGFASTSLKERLYDHLRLRESKDKNTYKSRWIRKLIKEGNPPIICLINTFYSNKEALNDEVILIDKYKNLGYSLTNSTSGGEGTFGYIPNEETRKKIGNGMRGKKHSPESCKKMSDSRKGKKLSEEHKKKIAEANIGRECVWNGKKGKDHPSYGRKWSNEQREWRASKGDLMSKEQRLAHNQRINGKGNPFYGKKHSDETRAKMKEAWKNRKKQYELFK
ncbi:MAG: NUMOD3 domain-containing DNA-binding protein, partial [Nanoarchaeota archaeon]